MTQPDDADQSGASRLDQATAELRRRPPTLPDGVADRVLRRALAAPRTALLVRAGGEHAFVRISTVALVALVRHDLDERLQDAAVHAVRCEVDRAERLVSVDVDVVVRYGAELAVVAQAARARLHETLRSALGRDDVTVHLHVVDVVVGDPLRVAPHDER